MLLRPASRRHCATKNDFRMSVSRSIVVHSYACMYMLFMPSNGMEVMLRPGNSVRGSLTLGQLSKGIISFVQVWIFPDDLENVEVCTAALRQQGAGTEFSRAAGLRGVSL
jgi:hypothetical protein